MREANDQIQKYVESLQPKKSAALEKIGAALKADGKWGINIGSVEGGILQFFVHTFNVKKVLEIGTQYGYSTQWMLEVLPADGHIVTLEKDPAHFEKARGFISDKRVEFLNGDAVELLAGLEDKAPFDLIFIDANKKAYPEYLEWAMKYSRKGSLIVGDNTFLFGAALQDTPPADESPGLWRAMRAFNQGIFSNNDYYSCIIPTAEGLTVAVKK
jgi:predicted O-methyltransferase YrrM